MVRGVTSTLVNKLRELIISSYLMTRIKFNSIGLICLVLFEIHNKYSGCPLAVYLDCEKHNADPDNPSRCDAIGPTPFLVPRNRFQKFNHDEEGQHGVEADRDGDWIVP